MRKLNIALAVIIVAAITFVAVDTARGATAEDCSHNPASASAVMFQNAEYGLRPYLLGIGTSWWQGKQRVVAAQQYQAQIVLCGDEARNLAAAQTRFYVMLRAFPQMPTRAQWKSRFRPLLQQAIRLDAAYLPLVAPGQAHLAVAEDKAWLVGRQFAKLGSPLLN